MNEDQLQAPQHARVKQTLRVAGLAVFGLGSVLTMIGFGSFFASFGSFEPPRYFWCAFLGLPMLFAGTSMAMFGFLGAIHRYVASESAPVAKDAMNYLGENIRPGVKSIAKAVIEGVKEGVREGQDLK